MSIRDVLIKSSELGYDKIAIISEMKGNPSRIDFQDAEGEIILSLDVTVGIPNSNANSKSRVKSENLKLYSEVSRTRPTWKYTRYTQIYRGLSIRKSHGNKKGLMKNTEH